MVDSTKALTVAEAALKLGLSISAVYALCSGRKLRHRRTGSKQGRIRIPLAAIHEYHAATEIPPITNPEPLIGLRHITKLGG